MRVLILVVLGCLFYYGASAKHYHTLEQAESKFRNIIHEWYTKFLIVPRFEESSQIFFILENVLTFSWIYKNFRLNRRALRKIVQRFCIVFE